VAGHRESLVRGVCNDLRAAQVYPCARRHPDRRRVDRRVAVDLRSRQLRELPQFSEAVRNIAVFYDGVVVRRVLLLVRARG